MTADVTPSGDSVFF